MMRDEKGQDVDPRKPLSMQYELYSTEDTLFRAYQALQEKYTFEESQEIISQLLGYGILFREVRLKP